MDDEDRKKANKDAICQSNDKSDNDANDANDDSDDCPTIYDMGGDSEMLLNKGVSYRIGVAECKVIRIPDYKEGWDSATVWKAEFEFHWQGIRNLIPGTWSL